MKKKDIKNIIIVALCITIICTSIGLMFVSTKLTAKNKEEKIFQVAITKIESSTPIKGGTLAPTGETEITNNNLTAKFNLTMNAPQDELAYVITIKNTGNITARIIDIVDSPDYLTSEKFKTSIYPVAISRDNVQDKILSPGSELKLKVVATYDITNAASQINVPYSLTVLATGRD